jgi:glycosyltransferase involved in cell wall biosynthesis
MTDATSGAPIRVAQILYSGLGGHASVAFSLVAGDADRQWRSSMLFVGIEPIVPAYRDECLRQQIAFESIRSVRGRPWRTWPSIVSALKRQRPDWIVLHSVSSLIPVAFYGLMYGARVIAVEHTPVALKSRGERIASGLALLLAKSVVVLSTAYRRQHLAAFPWFRSHRKVTLIPNGIDLGAWSNAPLRPDDGTIRIGMAARFSETKRQDLLVAAVGLLVRRRPRFRWRLSLAGEGENRARLKALVERSGLSGCVELPGNLGQIELKRWYASLDLYAHASEGEVLSTSMLQAMAMGLPVLASAVPGISELLEGEGSPLGLPIAENSAEAFAAGIAELAGDRGLRERLSAAARERVEAAYGQQAMFDAYNQLIEGLRS